MISPGVPAIRMAAAWILLSEVLTKKTMFWQGKPYFWTEKTSILRGFSKLALPRLAQGSKEWTWTSFMTFLIHKKNENIFLELLSARRAHRKFEFSYFSDC